MGVEPFDLDGGVTPAPAGPGAAGVAAAHRGGRWWGTAGLVVLVAAGSATVTGLHVRARVMAEQRDDQRNQVHLVATGSDLVAARTATSAEPGRHTSDVVLSLQVVNAGPAPVRLLELRADGAASSLHDALGSGQVLPAAQVTRVLLFGTLTCRSGDGPETSSAQLRVRAADGAVHRVALGEDVAERWSSALQRACALPLATP